MFKALIIRIAFAVFYITLLQGCDSHPTPKNEYINKNYKDFTIAEIEWDGVALNDVIQQHQKIAKERHQKIFIQITAEWCSPCRRLRKLTDDPLLKNAYQGTYIIRLDRDEWEKDFALIGIKKTPIPIFWELAEESQEPKVTSYALDGNYWKEITPKALAPVLKAYFSGKARPFLESKQSKKDRS